MSEHTTTKASNATKASSATTTSNAASRCALRLKVLSDSTRLGVMRILLAGPMHAGDLQRRIDIEQSLLSHHLRILREAGLVVASRDGKAVLYEVAPEVASQKSGEAINLGCCVLSFDA